MAQAVDADLLARAIAWSGESETAKNEIFNVTNGDVFMWPNVWPAIADALGFAAGDHVPLALDKEIRPREAEWAEICAQHGLRSGTLKEFVGLSFEYADYTMGYRPQHAGAAGARLDHQADAGGLPRGHGYRGDVQEVLRRDAGEEAAAAALTAENAWGLFKSSEANKAAIRAAPIRKKVSPKAMV